MRSLTIAQCLHEHDATIDIRFILSKQAPYAGDCPFPVFYCPSSPTKHNQIVKEHIEKFRPNIVLFDASGRVAQLRRAKSIGATTVFICQHNKKLGKALRFRRLRFTDKIWVVQPEFSLPALSEWSKLKLRLLQRPTPEAIGPIFFTPNASLIKQTLEKFELKQGQYILVNSGSGGHVVNNTNAAEEFAKAANIIATTIDTPVVVVYGPNYTGQMRTNSKCLNIAKLDARSFSALLSQSQAALLAGGSALFQGISFGINIVSATVSKDQDERIDACVKRGLIRRAELTAPSLADTLLQALNEKKQNTSNAIENGLARAKSALLELIE